MSSSDQEICYAALDSWVREHPFLDGEGKEPSSAVFGGLIAARALQDSTAAPILLSNELSKRTGVNPFLAEFFVSSIGAEETIQEIFSEHLGVLYASIRARLSLNEFASLMVYGLEEDEQEVENGWIGGN